MASLVRKVGRMVLSRGVGGKYKPVQLDEVDDGPSSGARERYTDSPDPEASVGLLSEESDSTIGPKPTRRRKNKCCVCCGLNCSLIFKIIGALALFAFLSGAYKLLKWAFYEPPARPEGMPEFSTSLGCLSAPFLYNNTMHTLTIPMSADRRDHGIDISGGAVGTLTVAEETKDTNNIRYEITLRSNDHDFLQRSIITPPETDDSGNVPKSLLFVSTPPTEKPNLCIRYDIKMFIPRSLKGLHLSSHSVAHVQFEPSAQINLEDLFVTLYASNTNNIVQTSGSVKADHMKLEVFRGWIVGDVSIGDTTSILTQRGDGVVHVNVYPEPPKDASDPQVAVLETTTGSGKTEVVYHGVDRPIDSTHISSRNGDMTFRYKDAKFNGLVSLKARSFYASGLKNLGQDSSEEEEENGGRQWTHFVGDKDGKDKVVISSRGWVGAYF